MTMTSTRWSLAPIEWPSRVPDRAEGRDPAPLEAMDDVPGERFVRDADHGLGAGGDVRPVGQAEHVRPPALVGVPDDRVGQGGEDFVDERGAVGLARIAAHPDWDKRTHRHRLHLRQRGRPTPRANRRVDVMPGYSLRIELLDTIRRSDSAGLRVEGRPVRSP
jgi:hypothetical protein